MYVRNVISPHVSISGCWSAVVVESQYDVALDENQGAYELVRSPNIRCLLTQGQCLLQELKERVCEETLYACCFTANSTNSKNKPIHNQNSRV